MLAPDLYLLFLERLEKAGIRYVVTGSVAVIVYGDPRMTHDIDLVVDLHRSQVNLLSSAFPDDEFYCPPVEVIATECARSTRGHFNIIHHATGFKADIYPVGNDRLLAWAVDNCRSFDFSGMNIKVAPPEYVIVKKLEFYREGNSAKHLTDIRGIIEISPELVSMELLDRLISQQGLQEVWQLAASDKTRS